ncbi:MAG: hypothetical protein ACKVOK_01375, partial [Flavobacteriales bacterium]
MAVTIINQPQLIELSRGPYTVRASTDAYATTVGAQCIVVLGSLDLAGAGDSMAISWPAALSGPNFVFSATPTGQQIKVIAAGQNVNEWIDSEVLPVMRSDARLTDFEIDRSSSTVIMKAKNYGAAYELDISFTGFAGTKTYSQHGVDAVVRTDMRLRMRVHVIDMEGNSNASPWAMYDVVPWQPNETTLVGLVDVDLTKILDGMLESVFPEAGLSTPAEWSHTRAFVEIAEHYDDGSTDPWSYQPVRTSLKVVAKGEMASRDRATFYYSRMFVGKRFITNRASGIKVWRDLEDWLFYYHDQGDTSDRNVKAKVYYTDGTTQETTLETYTDLHLKCRIIPCGFEQASLETLAPSLIPYKYEIWVQTSGGTTLVNKFVFWLLDEDDTSACIHYINAFGLAETLPIEGDHSFNIKGARELADVALPKEVNRETLKEMSYDRSMTPELVVQSIPLTSDEIAGYMDVALSKSVMYEIASSYLRVAAQIEVESIRIVPESRTGNQ